MTSAGAGAAVAIVCRISIDKSGRAEGCAAQEKWGRAYAAKTWPGIPVRVYADNNMSAAKDDIRPHFERFRTDVRAGEIRHVWAVEQSRLERREIEWFALAAELDGAGISDLHTDRDGIVRVTDVVAGIKAVLNAAYVREVKRKVNDKLGERAAQGRPHGGTVFGYRRGKLDNGDDTLVIVPEQAEAVRQAADQFLSGWSLTNVAAELERNGHKGARGGRITTSSLSTMLTSPSLAGLRVHSGEIVGKANWSPILTVETWQAIRARLATARTVKTAHGAEYVIPQDRIGTKPPRKYWIPAVARCGKCGAKMGGAAKTMRHGERRPYLSCLRSAGGHGCVGIMLDYLEDHVRDELFDELDKPEFLRALTEDDHGPRRAELTAALGVVDEDRAELAQEYGAGRLRMAEWREAREGLDAREGALRAALAAIPAPPQRLDIGDVRAAWPAMTLDERRALVVMFVAAVHVYPARRVAVGFDPERVKIEWKTADAA